LERKRDYKIFDLGFWRDKFLERGSGILGAEIMLEFELKVL